MYIVLRVMLLADTRAMIRFSKCGRLSRMAVCCVPIPFSHFACCVIVFHFLSSADPFSKDTFRNTITVATKAFRTKPEWSLFCVQTVCMGYQQTFFECWHHVHTSFIGNFKTFDLKVKSDKLNDLSDVLHIENDYKISNGFP